MVHGVFEFLGITVKKISLNRSAGKFKGHGRSLHVEEAFFFGAE